MSKQFQSLGLIVLVLLSCFYLFGFDTKDQSESSLLKEAEYYFFDEYGRDLMESYTRFEQLEGMNPENVYYKLMRGVLSTYIPSKKGLAVAKLNEAKAMDAELTSVSFYLGRAYASLGDFDEAIAAYNEFLLLEPDLPEEDKVNVQKLIKNAQNGKVILAQSSAMKARKISSGINGLGHEYTPVVSVDETMMVFTYRGSGSKGGLVKADGIDAGYYREDIFWSKKDANGNWSAPLSIADNINTEGHDAVISLSPDGRTLFVYKEDKTDMGDIYASSFDGEDWSRPRPLLGDVNRPDSWEGGASLSPDGKTLYFSSDRSGGVGGRDLYKATLDEFGLWRNVVNLGEGINTPLNEEAPFVHVSDAVLFFSSEGHSSIGGYDIFYATKGTRLWGSVKSLGPSVNTVDDESFYTLSLDGETGYIANASKNDKGKYDIYSVTPGFDELNLLNAGYFKGSLYADGQPLEGIIRMYAISTGEIVTQAVSKEYDGSYMLVTYPGKTYEVEVEVEGYPVYKETFTASKEENHFKVGHDIYISSTGKETGKATFQEDYTRHLSGEPLKDQIVETVKESSPVATVSNEVSNLEELTSSVAKEEMGSGSVISEKPVLTKSVVSEEVNSEISSVDVEGEEIRSAVATSSESTLVLPEEAKTVAEENTRDIENTTSDMRNRMVNEGVAKTPEDVDDLQVEDENVDVEKEEIAAAAEDLQGIVSDPVNSELSKESSVIEAGTERAGDEEKSNTLVAEAVTTAKKVVPESKEIEEQSSLEAKVDNTPSSDSDIVSEMTTSEIKEESSSNEAFVAKQAGNNGDAWKDHIQKVPCDAKDFVDFSWFAGKDLNKIEVYKQFVAKGGNLCLEGLDFRVQIAAYKFPRNYKWRHLSKYGDPLVKAYPDGVTRFTQGSFNTLAKAEEMRQKIILSGQKDAWVTAFYNGKRLLMHDLIQNNFYRQRIN